jgi:hypothetical protein
MSKEYKKAYEAAQAGGMNETDCHEFAQDQDERARQISIKSKRDADIARLAAFYSGRPVSI